MIPGTIARNSKKPSIDEQQESSVENISLPKNLELETPQTAAENSRSPSEKSYTRRELFSNAQAIFAEALTKTIRISNQLENSVREKLNKD